MVSISMSRERGATKNRFFFPYPNRPREGTIPSPSPSYKKGGHPGGRNPSRPRGGLVAGGSADPRRRRPRAGDPLHTRACHPSRTYCWEPGEPKRLFFFFFLTPRQLWGNAYESNLRPRASELCTIYRAPSVAPFSFFFSEVCGLQGPLLRCRSNHLIFPFGIYIEMF